MALWGNGVSGKHASWGTVETGGSKTGESAEGGTEVVEAAARPFGMQFPMRECDMGHLQDTRRTVKMGIRHALCDYRNNGPEIRGALHKGTHYGWCVSTKEALYGRGVDDCYDSEEEVQGSDSDGGDCDSMRSASSTKSLPSPFKSNMKDAEGSLSSNVSLVVAKNKILDMMFEIFESSVFDTDLKDLGNFVVNNILQDFPDSDITSVCNKIIGKSNREQLSSRIEELVADKYIEMKFESFYDRLFTSVSSFECTKSLECPRDYSSYFKIWKLDHEQYLYYDRKGASIDLLTSKHMFSRAVPHEYLVNLYADTAFLMNLDKFQFYYSRGLNIERMESRMYSDDEEETNSLFSETQSVVTCETANTYQYYTKSASPVSVDKRVSFVEPPTIIDIDRSRPSCETISI